MVNLNPATEFEAFVIVECKDFIKSDVTNEFSISVKCGPDVDNFRLGELFTNVYTHLYSPDGVGCYYYLRTE
jgi:hypothetical protein